MKNGKVVVAAVPNDDVGLLLGLLEDVGVVDTGVHDHAELNRCLVLLSLLNGRVRGVDVLDRREALHAHRLEIAVGHRMANKSNRETGVDKNLADSSAGLALPATRANGTDGDDRLGAVQHRRLGAEEGEVGASREHRRCLVHDGLMSEIGVGEDDLVHTLVADEIGQLFFRQNRNAIRVARAGKGRRVRSVVDPRNLSRCEGDHLNLRIVPSWQR